MHDHAEVIKNFPHGDPLEIQLGSHKSQVWVLLVESRYFAHLLVVTRIFKGNIPRKCVNSLESGENLEYQSRTLGHGAHASDSGQAFSLSQQCRLH